MSKHLPDIYVWVITVTDTDYPIVALRKKPNGCVLNCEKYISVSKIKSILEDRKVFDRLLVHAISDALLVEEE